MCLPGRCRPGRRLTARLLAAMLVLSGCDTPAEPDPPGLTGGWSTAGCELPPRPATQTVGGVTMPVTPPSLTAAMARIEAGGRTGYPQSYAGLEVDQAAARAIVYRVPSAAFDEFIRRSAEDACIVVRDAAHGLAELTAWHDRLVADLAHWAEQGIHIATVGARHDGVGVEVGTAQVDRARARLPARYGGDAPLIVIEQGPVVPLSTPAPLPGD